MTDFTKLVDDYVAVWNEPNAGRRLQRIESSWAPDGSTCYRLLDARGYDAIEARVIGSWDKWVREGNYAFRRKDAVGHHDAIKIDFEMIAVANGEVEAAGLTFLILDLDGRIKADYQFNPSANDAEELAERYVAIFNEPHAGQRRRRIEELWAPDGRFVAEASQSQGLDSIEALAASVNEADAADGIVFASTSRSQAHHNVARIKWQRRSNRDGTVVSTGSDLLVLDDSGRIRCDYRFDEPA